MKCQFAEHKNGYHKYQKDLHNFPNELMTRSSIIKYVYFLILVSNKVIDFCQKQGTRTQNAHFKLQNPI